MLSKGHRCKKPKVLGFFGYRYKKKKQTHYCGNKKIKLWQRKKKDKCLWLS